MIEQNEVALMLPEKGMKMLKLEERVNGEMLEAKSNQDE